MLWTLLVAAAVALPSPETYALLPELGLSP